MLSNMNEKSEQRTNVINEWFSITETQLSELKGYIYTYIYIYCNDTNL